MLLRRQTNQRKDTEGLKELIELFDSIGRRGRGKPKKPPGEPIVAAGWLVRSHPGKRIARVRSADEVLDDLRQLLARLGQAVEVVLALATRGNDAPMPQERQVMAHGRLAHVQLLTNGPDVLLPL